MQTKTTFNIPDFFSQNRKSIFWTGGALFILCVFFALFFDCKLLIVLPFGLLFLSWLLFDFKTIFFVLLIVLPVSVEVEIGSLGTDLPSEPIVILLSLCTLFYVLKNINLVYKYANHKIVVMLCLLYLWGWIATLFSTDVILSVKYMLAKTWYLLGFFVLPLLLLNNKHKIQQFFWCLFIPTFISILYVLVAHGIKGFTFDTITNAVHPIYRNHVNYAVFITMFLPFIFLAKSWYRSKSVVHAFLNFSILIFLVAIYFSYTRGAWLAVGAMLAYYFILKWNLTKYVLFILGIAVFVFLVLMLKDNNYLKYAPNYEHTIYHDELAEHLTSTFEMEDMSTVERFYRWIAAINMAKEQPLLGVGPNNFVSNYKQYTVTAYETYISDNEEKSTVHNYFLLLLTEQGVPAVLLFVLLIIVVLLTAQNAYNGNGVNGQQYVIATTLCIIAFLLNNTLSDLVEANKVGSLFYMCLGILINLSDKTSVFNTTNKE